jgi:hypothetical protein
MPKDKDLKRLTRARMQKTGESYTAARANLLAKKARKHDGPRPPATEPPEAAARTAPPDHAALAGMSDEAARAKTGRTWAEWVEVLDAREAAALPHGEIAAIVHEEFGISGWWSQSVTVGYERIKGLREIGQRRDGGYEASKSKTVPVSVERLRRAVTDRRLRARWLPDAEPTLRKTRSEQSARFTWEDGSPVVFWFVAKGEAKSQVAVTHAKLATRDEAEERKVYWGERLGALAELLKSGASGGR